MEITGVGCVIQSGSLSIGFQHPLLEQKRQRFMIILPFRITASSLRISESVHLFSMSVFMAKTFRHGQVLSAMVCFLCCYLYSTLRDSRAALKNQNVVVAVHESENAHLCYADVYIISAL
jgi:hypothetical protein